MSLFERIISDLITGATAGLAALLIWHFKKNEIQRNG